MGLAVTACEADGSYPKIWPVAYRREPMGSELEQLLEPARTGQWLVARAHRRRDLR
jgi:hypothetical protein